MKSKTIFSFAAFGLSLLGFGPGCFTAEMSWTEESLTDSASRASPSPSPSPSSSPGYSLANIPAGSKLVATFSQSTVLVGDCVELRAELRDPQGAPLALSEDVTVQLVGSPVIAGADLQLTDYIDPACTTRGSIAPGSRDPVYSLMAGQTYLTVFVQFSSAGIALLDALIDHPSITSETFMISAELLNGFNQVTTIAGPATPRGLVNVGGASSIRFNSPAGIFAEPVSGGTEIYLVDEGNVAIRKVTLTAGVFSSSQTLTGAVPGSHWNDQADGAPGAARLSRPQYLTSIAAGPDLFFDDNCVIRKVSKSTGVVTSIAGSVSAECGTFADGQGTSARFSWIRGLALDPDGTKLYVLDGSQIRIVNTNPASMDYQSVTTMTLDTTIPAMSSIAAKGSYLFIGNSSTTPPNKLYRVSLTPVGGVYLTQHVGNANSGLAVIVPGGTVDEIFAFAGNQVLRFDLSGSLPSVASDYVWPYFKEGGADGSNSGTGATAKWIGHGAFTNHDGSPRIYFTDSLSHSIRYLNSSSVYTVAGAGGLIQRVLATSNSAVQFYLPVSAAKAGDYAFYIHRDGAIDRVNVTGGSMPVEIYPPGGLNSPQAIAADELGSVFIVNGDGTSQSQVIRRISYGTVFNTSMAVSDAYAPGSHRTFASMVAMHGTSPVYLYAADQRYNQILRIDASSLSILTNYGMETSSGGYVDSTSPSSARFNYPGAIALSPDNSTLYVVDRENHVIRAIAVGGTGEVTTVAGVQYTYYGSRPPENRDATLASDLVFDRISSLAVDSTYLYVLEDHSDSFYRIDRSSGRVARILARHPLQDVDGSLSGAGNFSSIRQIFFGIDDANGDNLYFFTDFNLRKLSR